MSYAIRNDGKGWRAVNSAADVDQVNESYIVDLPTVPPIESVKSAKIAEIETAYLATIEQPIAYMGTTFQADPDSRALMNEAITGLQAIVAVGGTVPADFAWWDSNNNPVPMTLLQLQGLYATGTLAVNTAFKNKRAKKDAARAATTVAQVQAIVW